MRTTKQEPAHVEYTQLRSRLSAVWMTTEAEGSDVVFSFTESGRNLRLSAWDVATGAVQKTYNCDAADGGSSCCLLGRDYLLCALHSLPFIYVWNVKKEQVHLKIACVGLVNALTCTPDGTYCAAAIGEKIYIWEVSTGHLLAVVCQHYQPINVLKVTDEGTHLISGGADARVIVWRLASVLSDAFVSSGQQVPYSAGLATSTGDHPSVTRYVWSDHTLPVMDVYCGTGGLRARVATVSLDQTCKLYELSSGRLLCSFLFDFGLTKVTMDLAEHRLFVGGSTGKIAQVNLFLQYPGRTQQIADGQENKDQNQYQGHTKTITGLAVSTWGNLLVSSSKDGSTRVWDIASQQTIRTVSLKGVVGGMFLCSRLEVPFLNQAQGSSSSLPPLKPFQKQLYYSSQTHGTEKENQDDVPIVIQGIDPLCDLSTLRGFECGYIDDTPISEQSGAMEVHSLRQEMSELKDVHKRLYGFIVEELVQHHEKHN